MIPYLKSEAYILRQRKTSWLFPLGAVVLILSILFVIFSLFHDSGDSLSRFASHQLQYLGNTVGPMLMMLSGVVVFHNEVVNTTLKNTLSYGISRRTVIVGKTVMAIIYGWLVVVLVLCCSVVFVAWQTNMDGRQVTSMMDHIRKITLAQLPVLGVYSVLILLFCFHFRNQIFAIIAYAASSFVVQVILPAISAFTNVPYPNWVSQYHPDRLLHGLVDAPTSYAPLATTVALVWIFSISILNYLLFRFKDVK